MKIRGYENENYYLLWWLDMRHFPYNCLGLSDEDKLVSRTDNFVKVFNSVASSPALSYSCALHYFLTMSVGFHFNLTFGLKPQIGGIKIVHHCLQTIHFPSWSNREISNVYELTVKASIHVLAYVLEEQTPLEDIILTFQ